MKTRRQLTIRVKRKPIKRKSIKRKSIKRKSTKRKSVKRKSVKRKSVKRKSINNKSIIPTKPIIPIKPIKHRLRDRPKRVISSDVSCSEEQPQGEKDTAIGRSEILISSSENSQSSFTRAVSNSSLTSKTEAKIDERVTIDFFEEVEPPSENNCSDGELYKPSLPTRLPMPKRKPKKKKILVLRMNHFRLNLVAHTSKLLKLAAAPELKPDEIFKAEDLPAKAHSSAPP